MDQNNRWTFLIVGLLVSLVVLPVSFFAISIVGRVEGEEFSPQTFSTRHFSYVRFPIFHGRITSTVQSTSRSCSPQIANHLKSGSNPRWDLESVRMGTGLSSKRRAAICTQYVFENGEWESWTSEHAALAGVLWPAVQEMALENCYASIPFLLDAAKRHEFPESLQQEIDQICAKAALEYGDYLIANREFTEAKRCLEWGQSHTSLPELADRIQNLPATQP